MLAAADDRFNMLATADSIVYALNGAWQLHMKTQKPILVYDKQQEGTDPIAVVQVMWAAKEEHNDGEELGAEPESEPVGEAEGIHPEEQEEGSGGHLL
jgi:uncharacterized protein YllA (UPF0747 family)